MTDSRGRKEEEPAGQRADNVALMHGFNGMPIWVKIVAVLGFPIAVASLLLWFTVKQIEDHNMILKQHTADMDLLRISLINRLDDLVYAAQIACQRTAISAEEHAKCIRPAK